jgi:uncharacterized protein (DUF433 family)
MATEEILAECPQLTEYDIRAAIAYGLKMSLSRPVEFQAGVVG